MHPYALMDGSVLVQYRLISPAVPSILILNLLFPFTIKYSCLSRDVRLGLWWL